MPGAQHIAVKPLPGSSLDQALDARARAWAFVFDCYDKKKAAPESRPENAKERIKNDSRVHTRIP